MLLGYQCQSVERAFRPKRGSTLEAGALKQKDLRARWLGIPRCLVEQRREDVNYLPDSISAWS
ncbi:MAG: hypothetical protein F6K24_11830 [Okeania sp. SIO2D1]|nr:hypothetical protein [Okeania sp. SIO2D1]